MPTSRALSIWRAFRKLPVAAGAMAQCWVRSLEPGRCSVHEANWSPRVFVAINGTSGNPWLRVESTCALPNRLDGDAVAASTAAGAGYLRWRDHTTVTRPRSVIASATCEARFAERVRVS